MAHKHGLPLILHLDPEEAEAAITLGVGFHPVEVEALRDGRLHLGHRARRRAVDVRADAVAPVHDERPGVHASFRRRDEVEVVRPTRPGRVDVGVRMEDVGQILPFAGIAASSRRCVVSRCALGMKLLPF